MKYGQLKKYNMKNIFLEESYPKCGGETILRYFSKKIEIEHISRSVCIPLDFTSHKAFTKNKKRPGISFSALFSA